MALVYVSQPTPATSQRTPTRLVSIGVSSVVKAICFSFDDLGSVQRGNQGVVNFKPVCAVLPCNLLRGSAGSRAATGAVLTCLERHVIVPYISLRSR